MQNVTLTRNVVGGVVAFIGMSSCFGLSLEKNLHLIILRRDYLTIIPRARMGYYHEGETNNCFRKIQLVGQKYGD